MKIEGSKGIKIDHNLLEQNTQNKGYEFFPELPPEDYSTSSIKSGWTKEFSDKVRSWGVSNYTWNAIKDTADAIKKSQNHLIDLIRYYEGDATNNYKARPKYKDLDGTGTTTYGYGVTHLPAELGIQLSPPTNEEEAYNFMLIYMDKVAMDDIRVTIGINLFNSAPDSVQEALLDYAFKNGRPILSKNKETFKTAILNKDWPTLLKTLVHIIPGGKDAEKVENAGLYRRSLSRAILATRDLPESDEIKNTIKDIYA